MGPYALSVVSSRSGALQIYEEVSEGAEELDLGGSKVNMRAYCTWFNFKGADQQKKLSVLSGGERNLQLAKVTNAHTLSWPYLTIWLCLLSLSMGRLWAAVHLVCS